jgi:hypothetical protein
MTFVSGFIISTSDGFFNGIAMSSAILTYDDVHDLLFVGTVASLLLILNDP